MTDTITIKQYNHSYVLVDCPASIAQELSDYFSFFVDGYRFNPKFKYGSWDGKIRLVSITPQGVLLPYGLIDQLKKFTSNMMYDLIIEDGIAPEPIMSLEEFNEWIDGMEIYSGSNRIEPHWYQRDAVLTGINDRRSILNLPTSAGKSLIQCLLSKWYTQNHSDRVLIIVPTTALVTQMKNDFLDYRLFESHEILEIRGGTDKTIRPETKIVVSTWQSAVKQPKSWFDQFGMLLTDECFDGDTLISTPDGDKKIKDIKPGDHIYSMDEVTKEIIIDEVIQVHENMAVTSFEKMYELEMDNGTVIKVTGNHKFMTQRGWVRADELTEDDDIVEF